MTQNQPTLTPLQALTVALAAWIGLALALVPAARAVAQPFQSLWLALDGLGDLRAHRPARSAVPERVASNEQ